eukprot:TRINITY_DN13300_c0_g1_i4.p1 TRINITY_DN13300_c0_g1~~TRINITY_DN13300_c0_g1_i4.p1  ORF type:complete len:354 (+),score=70.16 TRINITY_DN13300_c0_g1_i4:73-1134(+)
MSFHHLHARPSQSTAERISHADEANQLVESKDDQKAEAPVAKKSRLQVHVIETPSFQQEGGLYDNQAEELNFTNRRISEMPSFHDCQTLKTLILRQNALTTVGGLAPHIQQTLTQLDLYENHIEAIDLHLQQLANLTWLDISFNGIRVIENLEGLAQLRELYLAHNKITTISGLQHLNNLTLLELGSNRIRTIENLEGLNNLRELWLGRNKISAISGLESLVSLQRLSLQSNRLLEMGQGLAALHALTELYLSHNGITRITGINTLVNLRILDLGNNQIQKIEGIDSLSVLQELWLNHNQISDWEDLDQLVSKVTLNTIYLEGNPLHRHPEYKNKVLSKLPWIKQLDWEDIPH